MIVCEVNSLSTTDLPRRAVASETFKEHSEKKNWSFSTKYGQCYRSFSSFLKLLSLFLLIYQGYKPTMVLKINA